MEHTRVIRKQKDYRLVVELMRTAFSPEERIPIWVLNLLSKKRNVNFNAWYDNGEFCGITYTIESEKMIFLLYFAVNAQQRSKGYGSRIIHELKQIAEGREIILNVEKPDQFAENNTQRVQRIAFYEKNGFSRMCITLITGYIISREYTDDTLKNIITIPVSFQKILAGKLIISGILSVFLGAVCFAFTVVANFIMGYGGFSISAAFTGLLQMSLLGLLLYLTMLPIIVLTSRKKSSFLAGVIIAFVYGFVGMFANGALQSIYPVSATLGLIRYRNGVEGVTWNTGLCLISVLAMCIIGVACMFLKPKTENQNIKKIKRVAPKKGW